MTAQPPAPLVERAITDLLGLVDRRYAAGHSVRHVVETLAMMVSRQAEGDLLASLRSSAQVAAELGITPGRVSRLARSRGVGLLVGRDWLFRPSDVDAMRTRQPGRPWPKRADVVG